MIDFNQETIKVMISLINRPIEENKEIFIGSGELYEISCNKNGVVIFFKEGDEYLRNEVAWGEYFEFINKS